MATDDPKSVKEAVERWDKGETLWTVEMGGMGPGYEQAIQVLMVEILRSLIPFEEEKHIEWTTERFQKIIDETVRIHKEALGGMSGAQIGAAGNIAWKFFFDGWEGARRKAKEQGMPDDRWCMISKDWPHANRRCSPRA